MLKPPGSEELVKVTTLMDNMVNSPNDRGQMSELLVITASGRFFTLRVFRRSKENS